MDVSSLSALPPNPRILVIRLSAMGDLVFALPAIKALKNARPDATIDWLVEDKHSALLTSCPFINEVIIYPRSTLTTLSLFKHLKALRNRSSYDVIFDLQSNSKSAMQLLALKSKHKFGFARGIAKEGAHFFHHHHVNVTPRMHRTARDTEFVKSVIGDIAIPEQVRWPLDVTSDGSGLTLLHTTTTHYGRDKDWGADNWAALASQLKEDGHDVALLHTPADLGYVQRIANTADVNLAPTTPSLEHLMALLDESKLLISTDSGPAHIAALRGNKVVCLFGATDPVVYAPPGNRDNIKVIYAGDINTPPPKRQRDRQSLLMKKIAVADVLIGLSSY
jgi:ADP-heptose:LPS heptosyltransferase